MLEVYLHFAYIRWVLHIRCLCTEIVFLQNSTQHRPELKLNNKLKNIVKMNAEWKYTYIINANRYN